MNKRITYYFLLALMLVSLGAFAQKKGKGSKSSKGGEKSSISYRSQEYLADGVKAKMIEDISSGDKDYSEAIRLFNLSVKEDSKNDAAYYELGLIYFESGQFENSKKFIAQALEINPTVKWYLIVYAALQEQQQDYEGASATYKTIIENHPDEISQYFEWARMLMSAGEYEEALKVYSAYEAKEGFDEQVIRFKHLTYREMGEYDKAVLEIRKLIDHNPSDIGNYQTLAELYKKESFDEVKLREVLDEILKIDPTNTYALYNLAEIFRSQGDRAGYLKYVEEAFKNPNSSIDEKVGIIYPYTMSFDVDKERKEEILSLAQILIEVHPDEAVTHKMYGRLLQQDNQAEEALEQFKKALELDGSDFDTWQQSFFITADLQRYKELITLTDEALLNYPNQAIIYYFSGIAYNQLENYDMAAKKLESGIKRSSGNLVLKAQMYGTLAEAYNGLKEYTESDNAFEKAIALDNSNPYVLNNYSYYLSVRGENLERAQELSKLSNDMEPGNASFQDTYAWILYKSEKYEEAKTWIEKAIKSLGVTQNGEVTEHYGDILFKLGETDSALEQWKRADTQGGGSDKLKDKIANRQLYE